MSVRVRFTAIRLNARDFPAANAAVKIRAVTKKFAEGVRDEVKTYPPEVAGSRYTRTHRLENYWLVRDVSAGSGIQYEIINAVQDPRGHYYSGYVSGSEQQSWHHAHGWKNIQQVIQDRGGRGQLAQEVQDIITREMKAV